MKELEITPESACDQICSDRTCYESCVAFVRREGALRLITAGGVNAQIVGGEAAPSERALEAPSMVANFSNIVPPEVGGSQLLVLSVCALIAALAFTAGFKLRNGGHRGRSPPLARRATQRVTASTEVRAPRIGGPHYPARALQTPTPVPTLASAPTLGSTSTPTPTPTPTSSAPSVFLTEAQEKELEGIAQEARFDPDEVRSSLRKLREKLLKSEAQEVAFSNYKRKVIELLSQRCSQCGSPLNFKEPFISAMPRCPRCKRCVCTDDVCRSSHWKTHGA